MLAAGGSVKITNRYGLPGALVEAVGNDSYTGHTANHDISVSQLISPPRQVALMRRHWDAIEEDASSRIWALLGQAVHTILERAEPSAIVEQRLFTRCLGWTVSGQFDRLTLRQATLQDYKVAPVWEAMNGLKPEREQQLNLLAHLALANGYGIRRLEVVHICRDWSVGRSKQGGDYPSMPVRRIPVALWPEDRRLAFMRSRVRLHQQAHAAKTQDLPPCSPEDRWERATTYAVMREGRKTAVRIHDSRAAAALHAEAINAEGGRRGGRAYVEVRPGESVRCASYCAVAGLCSQHLAETAAKRTADREPA